MKRASEILGGGGGLPVAPSLEPALASVQVVPREQVVVSRRLVTIAALAVGIGIAGGVVAKVLIALIGLITNLVFYERVSTALVPPTTAVVGAWVLVIPVAGALVIGLMARYGSAAIRGHGIPEVMEKVLYGQSRIPARLMFLKPLSAALAIGTGGPFGAEGPIIATGGALGSVVGQILRTTSDERKTLLAAGAAAGMAATFGTPVSAVLLSIELLLFEYRARSIIPVALAASAATGVRMLLMGTGPVFPMGVIGEPRWTALVSYVVLGAVVGVASVYVTRLVYAVEDWFERLPVHWMWWPALGAVAVGVIGYIDPRVLGVGYQHIDRILSGNLVGWTLVALVVLKLVAWSIYLGSGTSGGTLAPLFIIGGGLGAALGSGAAHIAPGLGISVPVAALVGMAAIFAGASHALLASIVFAFEATRQPLGLLPLLAGCSAAYLISTLMMETSIMTEKLARRGARVRPEYALDFLTQVLVRDAMTTDVVSLSADEEVERARAWLASRTKGATHQGFPVVSAEGTVVGVLTRRDLLAAEPGAERVAELVKRPPAVAFPDNTLREAADHMVREGVGRLPVIDRETGRMVGIVSRSDLLSAHEPRLRAAEG
ncbi:MAG TPA: chloride channel protein [Longimicrobiales bacterium]|nr:chloride channel protein [Longimicrobiales bacterium]